MKVENIMQTNSSGGIVPQTALEKELSTARMDRSKNENLESETAKLSQTNLPMMMQTKGGQVSSAGEFLISHPT